MSVDEIVQIYKQAAITSSKEPIEQVSKKVEPEAYSSDDQKSPLLVRRSNPFKKTSDEVSPSLLHRVRRRLPIKSRLKPTVIDETAIPQSKFFAIESTNQDKNVEAMDVVKTVANVVKEDCKENMHIPIQNVIIPETEDYDDDMLTTEQEVATKDSGYKGSSLEKDVNVSTMSCDDSEEPLHLVANNSLKKEELKLDNTNETKKIENDNFKVLNEAEDMEFSITREVFSEYKSSMFKYDSPVADKRLRRDGNASQSSQRSSQLSQGSSSRRSIRNSTKKTATIQGQQSLLNMFGFQKKSVFKH